PTHHDVQATDVDLKRLHGVLAAAADRGPKDFRELLLTPGVGPRTVASLALVAEVIHGAPARFSDPARFSLALGGKDGHPFLLPEILLQLQAPRMPPAALELRALHFIDDHIIMLRSPAGLLPQPFRRRTRVARQAAEPSGEFVRQRVEVATCNRATGVVAQG